MRTAPTALAAALLAALTLTACSSGDGDGGGDDGKTSAAPAESGKGAAACTAAKASFEIGPSSAAPAAGDEGAVPVTVTNKSGAACVLKGTADVEMTVGERSWPVGAQQGVSKDTEVTVEDGQAVSFAISYVRGVAGDAKKGATVDKLNFRLPGDSKVNSYDWPDPEIAFTSGGTLEAKVGPFLPVGD
ncbi:DUF4232 domain-containing protein [Streptomyces sp. NPDC012510]|jgi:hypothetical protein|uniref:DUF4232 domain-containing protein n=1 Tax=Streptomyces sp. NPDC012510 TaxID=3364838 RepID=UPI0036EA820C